MVSQYNGNANSVLFRAIGTRTERACFVFRARTCSGAADWRQDESKAKTDEHCRLMNSEVSVSRFTWLVCCFSGSYLFLSGELSGAILGRR